MQIKNIAISAFAASALAQQLPTGASLISVISVLQTALPQSLYQEALTNSAAVSSQIASQFLAGETPSWYSALPNDIKTIFYPSALPTALPTTGLMNSSASTTMISNGTIIPSNGTTTMMNGTASTTSTRGRTTVTDAMTTLVGSGGSSGGSQTSAGANGGSSSSESDNAAPTAFIGMGLAGAVGLVGLLAL